MTEKEKIIEELTEKLLTEMAIPRSEFRDDLKSQCPIVRQHLILILTQPDNTAVNHWKGEIYGNFSKFKKLKNTNKYPTVEDFMDCGMETCFEEIEDQLEADIIDVYSRELGKDIFKVTDVNIDMDVDKLKIYVANYFKWAINNMNPKTGIIDKADAYKEMDNIIHEYNK